MDREALREAIESAPRQPGVYQFFEEDTALYFGKAVDLRSRLRSYLDPRSRRISAMVRRASHIETAVTDTETQALLLEANLIKRHQPRYNVRLTDDKSYPLVQFSDHGFPRIEVTRDPESNATVFGPYTDAQRLHATVKAIRERYGLRGCSDHKFANRDRPCLDFELGLCAAPCTGEIDADAYAERTAEAKRFFEGEVGVVATPLREEMAAAAERQQFERAANLRDRLDAVERLHGQHEAAIASRGDERLLDVLGVAVHGDRATIARLHSEGGQLVERDTRTMAAPSVAEEKVAVIIGAFLAQYYAERRLPDAILVQELPIDENVHRWLDGEGVDLRLPAGGREETLLDLALKNAAVGRRVEGDPLAVIAERLHIERPHRIEGIDVSHAHGRAVVGSNVTFVDGMPDKTGYRRKKLPDGNDDPDRIGRLAAWRAQRAVEGRDDRPDPDLFLVDGGEVHLRVVREAFDAHGWSVPVVALAKREEAVISPDGIQRWTSDDPALHVLQRVRDEAHRFAVSYHQSIRDSIHSILDDVPGIGPTRRRRLLRRFGGLDGVRAASRDELLDIDGIGEATVDELLARL